MVDVSVDILGTHADTVVAYGQRTGLAVYGDAHLEFAQLTLDLAA